MKGPWPLEAIFEGSADVGVRDAAAYPEGLDAIDVDGDGLVDLLAGNCWFKYTGGPFQPIRVGTIGSGRRQRSVGRAGATSGGPCSQ
jgi:hypothetical protein